MSELERQRQANIERNKELLRQLELAGMSQNLVDDVKKQAKKPAKPRTKVKREPKEAPEIVPRRKSRRLEGKKADFEQVLDEQRIKLEQEEIQRQRERDRVEGEIKLKDVVKKGDWESAINLLSDLGSKVSQGDYFDIVSKTNDTEPDIKKAREELSNLSLFEDFDPSGVKITQERVLYAGFHPVADKAIVMAGDKYGELGIWDSSGSIEGEQGEDDEEPEKLPSISSFKTHSRGIAKIAIHQSKPQSVYTASYDGSIRCLDLATQSSTEALVIDSDPRNPLGVSDVHLPDPNLIYYTTLEGGFGTQDLRTKGKHSQYQLHEKKIGGFGYNPSQDTQIVTASLDRTFKVWDLRYLNKDPESHSMVPHLYGQFESRLSVSCADWNSSGQIVVNGYDDRINILDFTNATKWDKSTSFDEPFKPQYSIKHNCQTGRWVSILKSRWHAHPEDNIQKFVIANMSRFIDVYSSTGQQLAHLGHELMTAVPAATSFHPSRNWLVGVSASGKAYLWT